MGTHPIFESDFDCLTEKRKFLTFWRSLDRLLLRTLVQLGLSLQKLPSPKFWPKMSTSLLNTKFLTLDSLTLLMSTWKMKTSPRTSKSLKEVQALTGNQSLLIVQLLTRLPSVPLKLAPKTSPQQFLHTKTAPK